MDFTVNNEVNKHSGYELVNKIIMNEMNHAYKIT